MPQPWEHREQAENKQEQAFIDAWADLRTQQLHNLFPKTAERTLDKDGNASWKSLSSCQDKHRFKKIRDVINFAETDEKFFEAGITSEYKCLDCDFRTSTLPEGFSAIG